MKLALTYFPRLTGANGQRVRTTWPALLERLSKPREVASKHDAPGLSLATYTGDRRGLSNVEQVFAIGLDLDHLDALSANTYREPGDVLDAIGWDRLTGLFGRTDSFVHTTWSSTDEAPRARVFLRLSRPVSGDEYRRVYAGVASRCETIGLVVDRAASDPSRFWFLPSVKPGAAFRYSIGRGRAVDVEGCLASTPPPEPPRPPAPSGPRVAPSSDVEARAAAYLEKCEPAISGSGGHTRTFLIAQKMVLGFELDEGTAFRLMQSWNARCQPPWSERELRRKIREAALRGRVLPGFLRDAQRKAS